MNQWSHSELSPMQAEIFIELEKYAEKGTLLPNDVTIGRRFYPAMAGGTITSALLSMSNKGFISMERFGPHRVITICATGKRTGMPPADVIAENVAVATRPVAVIGHTARGRALGPRGAIGV